MFLWPCFTCYLFFKGHVMQTALFSDNTTCLCSVSNYNSSGKKKSIHLFIFLVSLLHINERVYVRAHSLKISPW